MSLGESALQNSSGDEEDEVLTKTDRRLSLLSEVERDESIRHVDSDVESDDSETSDLNRVSYKFNYILKLDFF